MVVAAGLNINNHTTIAFQQILFPQLDRIVLLARTHEEHSNITFHTVCTHREKLESLLLHSPQTHTIGRSDWDCDCSAAAAVTYDNNFIGHGASFRWTHYSVSLID